MKWRQPTTNEIDAMEHEAVQTLLSKGCSMQEIELMKTNIQAMVAPIVRHQFKNFYEEINS